MLPNKELPIMGNPSHHAHTSKYLDPCVKHNMRPEPLLPHYHRHRDPVEDISRNIKVDALEFDGRLEIEAFLDQLESIKEYFDWYHIPDY